MMKYILKITAITFFVISFCSALHAEKKLTVVTTLFPTYDFARQIGKEKVEVSLLLPPGVEPHSFEPTPRDIVRIHQADLFIYTGKYMEPWIEDILTSLSNNNVLVVDVSKGIRLLDSDHEHAHEEKHLDSDHEDDHDDAHEEKHMDLDHEDDHDDAHEEKHMDLDHEDDHDDAHEEKHMDLDHEDDHDDDNDHDYDEAQRHGQKDPHIWLDPENDQIIIKTIVHAMIQKDPENKSFYLHNTEIYDAKLAELNRRFQVGLSNCKHRTIVSGGHFTFSYLAKKLKLKQISAYNDFAPNAEPGPKAVGEMIKKLRKSGIKVIYHEELINPRIARLISRETGTQLRMLHGAHNVSRQELKEGRTFLEIMEKNLNQLKSGLECQ